MPGPGEHAKVHPMVTIASLEPEIGNFRNHASFFAKTPTSAGRGFGFKSFRKTPVSGLQEDGTAEVHTLYLISLWLALRAPFSWRTFGIFMLSLSLGLLQTAVALNMAW